MLSGSEILKEYLASNIYINPFVKAHLGPNGYDVTLSKNLLKITSKKFDMRLPYEYEEVIIPPEGIELQPGELWLGATNESAGSDKYVPMFEGRSSTGRMFIEWDCCAGAGDVGFDSTWTLEIRVERPTHVYAGVRIAQIMFIPIQGEIDLSYKKTGKYNEQTKPQPSKLWMDFLKDPVC